MGWRGPGPPSLGTWDVTEVRHEAGMEKVGGAGPGAAAGAAGGGYLVCGEPNVYAAVFTLLISYLGQYLLANVMVVGIGMLFFSLIEDKEHLSMLDRIEEMGGGATGNEGMA